MIQVNGQEQNDSEGICLADYVCQKGYFLTNIAVEYNDKIIPKDQYSHIILKDGDVLEIINFVGGG